MTICARTWSSVLATVLLGSAMLMWNGGCAKSGTNRTYEPTVDAGPGIPGLEQTEPAMPVIAEKPTPPPKPAPIPAQKPGCVTIAYPTGDRATSYALLEKCAPPEVQVGQSFDCTLTVTNLSSSLCLENVVVTDHFPSDYKLLSATPEATISPEGTAQWSFGRINPKESRTIRMTGSMSKSGTMDQCAGLTCTPRGCLSIVAVAPAIKLLETAPAEVMLCDPIPVTFKVTNTGDGAAKNARIRQALPAGLTTEKGASSIDLDAGMLAPGQSREFTVKLLASKIGSYQHTAAATADGGLTAEATAATMVRQPVLTIAKTGREMQYIGQPFAFDIVVSNKGDAVAKDVIITDALPANAKVQTVSNGGQVQKDKIQWAVGNIEPGGSKTISVTMVGTTPGEVYGTARAMGACAPEVNASARTLVKGIPAVLLEVVDMNDPVELGKLVTYEVVVTNQGSAPVTNLKVACIMEEYMQYQASTGPTQGAIDNQTLTFAPLATLAPQAKVSWKVTVKALREGDVRFKTILLTDQIDRPVEETESTRFYK